MKTTITHQPYWAHKTENVVLAPLRLAGDIVFCGFVVVAAFTMLLVCTLLATLDLLPWKMNHPAA